MSTKNELAPRLEGIITSLQALNITADPASGKKDLADLARKAGATFGVLADRMENLGVVKALAEEVKSIKRADFDTVEKFVAALDEHRGNVITAVTNLLEEVQTLPEDAGVPDAVTGTAGTRTTFRLELRPIGQPDAEPEVLGSGDFVKAFIASEYFSAVVAKNGSVADNLRKYIREGRKQEYPLPNGKSDEVFYKLYRLIRPTLQKAITKAQTGETPTEEATTEEAIA